MKNFKKSSKLDHVCYDIRGPVMDEANRLIAQGCEILKLNIGNPAPFSLMAPEFIPEQMTSSLYASEGYSDSKGILPAREAIAAYCAKKGIVGVTSDDVYTGNGVSELITMVMQGLLDSGDEVLLPAPDYPLWTASVGLAAQLSIISAMNPPTGTRTSRICAGKSRQTPRPSSSSTRTIPPALCIRRRCWKRLPSWQESTA